MELREQKTSFTKDSAREEMNIREGFENKNRVLNRYMSQRNPLIAVPDERVQILDMVPRLDIIEDQFFRKSIPKSTRMYKFRKNFSDASDNISSGINFMKAIVKDGLHEARERDVKYGMRA